MRISDLRNQVSNSYLSRGPSDVVSAAEAKKLVQSGASKSQLVKIRDELMEGKFDGKFSKAGLRAFNKEYAKMFGEPPPRLDVPTTVNNTAASPNSALGIRAGIGLDAVPTTLKLSEVRDPQVRSALERLDVNLDRVVDKKDAKSLGLSDDQFRMFMFTATLMGQHIKTDVNVPTDLSGKTVVLTAVPDSQKAKGWVEAMGGKVARKVSPNVDYVFVGNASRTSKDERALILNNLGQANIEVAKVGAFFAAAHKAGVTGSGPAPLSRGDFKKARDAVCKEIYTEVHDDMLADELSYASTPAEKKAAKDAHSQALKDYDGGYVDAPDEWFGDWISDRYPDDPFLDRDGRPISEDDIETFSFSFSSDVTGQGLSLNIAMDRRTGEVLDQSDITD